MEANIERLISRHKQAVYRQMVRVCGNHADAEDALSTAILAALRAAESIRDPGNFHAWLVRVGSRACARRRIRDHIASQVSLEELSQRGFDLSSDESNPGDATDMAMFKARVTDAIDGLPEVLRETYIRRELEQESAESVARALKISVAAVKSRLHRARLLMRATLDACVDC